MRLPGRVAAAIECLGPILEGRQVEPMLREWGRRNRFAGSKDRSAIRDIVYDILRKRQSFASLGGGDTPRALVLGWVRQNKLPIDEIFGQDQFGPSALSVDELNAGSNDPDALNFQDWAFEILQQDHREKANQIAAALSERASVDLRVHATRADPEKIQSQLADEGFETDILSSALGLRLTGDKRSITQSKAYADGLIELQDAHSQEVCEAIAIDHDWTVLDYCAGAGGKSLALAAKHPTADYAAWDAHPRRLQDLPDRAARAQSAIQILTSDPVKTGAQYNCVILDVPCSGSGSWRRDPQGKWLLTQESLHEVIETQRAILSAASQLVAANGQLVYITCSVFNAENQNQVDKFIAQNNKWTIAATKSWLPNQNGDGFFLCILKNNSAQ